MCLYALAVRPRPETTFAAEDRAGVEQTEREREDEREMVAGLVFGAQPD